MSKIGLYDVELSDVIRQEDAIEAAFAAYEAKALAEWDGGPFPDLRDVFRAGWEAAAAEIEALREIVRELYEPACAELGPACEDIAKDRPDVLDRALKRAALPGQAKATEK